MVGTGSVLLKMGKYGKALRVLEEAIERDPGNYLAWMGKGLSHAKLHQRGRAIEAYERALRCDPPEKDREVLLALLQRARESREKKTGG